MPSFASFHERPKRHRELHVLFQSFTRSRTSKSSSNFDNLSGIKIPLIPLFGTATENFLGLYLLREFKKWEFW